jgi:hypothetical protein
MHTGSRWSALGLDLGAQGTKAEGKGFEPLRPCGLPVFKTGAFNQTPPPLRVGNNATCL